MFADSLCERMDRELGYSGHPTMPVRLARRDARKIGTVLTGYGLWVYGLHNGNVYCWTTDQRHGQAMGCGTVARFVRPNGFVAV